MRTIWTTDQLRALAAPRLDRRALLRLGAAAAGGVAMAPFIPRPARAQVGGDLRILVWEGFSMEAELADWLAENGVALDVAVMSTQDDVHARLIGSTPTALDVSEFNQGYNRFYGDELGIILPMDEALLPNYNATDTFPGFYKQDTWYWDGKLFGVPWVWGLNSLVYNPALVPEPASYQDLLKPEFAGLLTFGDDTLATWPMIARVAGLGDRFPNLTPDELAAAFEAAKPFRDQCRVFAASNGDAINLFVGGEIGALYCGWSGIPNETAKQGVETRYVIPAEGAAMWCDAWFVPISATNVPTAHAYVNATLGGKAQADVCKAVVGGAVQRTALEHMDAPTRALFDYDNLDAVFASSPLQGIPPRESAEFATFDEWVTAWEDFKLGF